MLTFSSSAAGNVSMLDAHAKQLLELIGKAYGPRGVITAAEAPAALAALRAAAARDQAQTPADDAGDSDDPEARERRAQHVGLGQRAYPLMELLERSQRAGKDVTWGL